MNSLVLGGNGFIGSHLVDQLLNSGHNVRVFDQELQLDNTLESKIDYHCGNFSDLESTTSILNDIDIVFHLISTTVPSTSNLNPIDDVQSNLVATITLLENMRKNQIRKIVYFSSGGTIYGENHEPSIPENYSQNPICSYGIVKLAVEKYLLMYEKLHKFEPLILRLSNPYGPRQKKSEHQGLIGTFLSNIKEGNPIEIWGDGEIIRDYIYISDVISACSLAIEKNITGIFNIGTGVGYSINQIVALINEVYPSELNIIHREKRSFDVDRVVLDIRKASNVINWAPKVMLKEGLSKHIEWLLSR